MDLVQTDLLLPKYWLVLYTVYSTCCYMVLSQTSDAKPSVYPNHLNGQKIGAHPPLLNKPMHFLCGAAVAQSDPISSYIYIYNVCVSLFYLYLNISSSFFIKNLRISGRFMGQVSETPCGNARGGRPDAGNPWRPRASGASGAMATVDHGGASSKSYRAG